jgi:mannobiose 2-epimerase
MPTITVQRLEQELTGNILPFWVERTPDPVNGGFYGALSNDLKVDNASPRSAVLYGRILWTFSLAYKEYKRPEYLETARRAYDYIKANFWDAQHGGVYWSVDVNSKPLDARKHTYANSFCIYGLAEYHQATGDAEALGLAKQIFELLEAHSHDSVYGGYVEGRGGDWISATDPRLSSLEPLCDKSMNTLLHTMEAFTNLLRVWDEPRLRTRVSELITIFLDHIIDPQTNHQRLFFNNDWSWSKVEHISYGHDIETSWLLVESVEVLGDSVLLERAKETVVKIVQAIYNEALQPDGVLLPESDGHRSRDLVWWVHAEGMVGFYNAYQLSGDEKFRTASERIWRVIDQKFIDRQHGDWFKTLDPQGVPYPDSLKVGPWDCPYHHSRACFEMIRRLS